MPPLPRKNETSTSVFSWGGADDDDDASSVSSVSTTADQNLSVKLSTSLHKRATSVGSARGSRKQSPRQSSDEGNQGTVVILYREEQRVSLRAFLRTFLQNPLIANSAAMKEFLTGPIVQLNQEELQDVERRKEMDIKRIEEQKKFYEIARQRAAELDIYMERFRRDIVERSKSRAYQHKSPALSIRRWTIQVVCRDPGQGKDCRSHGGIPEIR